MATKTTPTRTRRTRSAAKTAAPKAPQVEIPAERPVEGYVVDLQAEGTETSRTFEKLLGKDPNENHVDFAEWFKGHTGEELDLRTIQLTLATWHEFQRSPEHKAKTQERRQAAAIKRAEKERARVERLQRQLEAAKKAAKA